MLDISPGLMIWTLVNFGIFAFILAKFAWKPMIKGLQEREEHIDSSIMRAEEANKEAQKILKENEEKLAQAQQEMMKVMREGREQAEAQLQAALAKAEELKKQKLDEARAEINREREAAMQALRDEVASMVIMATERILKENLDTDKQKSVIDSFIQEIHKN